MCKSKSLKNNIKDLSNVQSNFFISKYIVIVLYNLNCYLFIGHDDYMGRNNKEFNLGESRSCIQPLFKIRLNRSWDKTFSRERNNPPYGNRNFKRIQFGPRLQFIVKDCNWYRICVSDIFVYYIIYIIYIEI